MTGSQVRILFAAPAFFESETGRAPKYVVKPAPVNTTTQAPTADQPVADKRIPAPKTAKPKRKRESTEARVIHELHRHGIYW
jgi:hypothetical protein